LFAIIQSPAQFHGALNQRIIGHERVGPDGLHQLFLWDESTGMLYQVLEGFIYLRAELDLLAPLQNTPSRHIQRKAPKLICFWIRSHRDFALKARTIGHPSVFGFSLALFRYFTPAACYFAPVDSSFSMAISSLDKQLEDTDDAPRQRF